MSADDGDGLADNGVDDAPADDAAGATAPDPTPGEPLTVPTVDGATPAPDAQLVDLDLRVAAVAVATIVALVIAIAAISAASTFVTLAVIAGLMALALNPVVDRVQERTSMARGNAVATCCGVAAVVILTIVALFGRQTVEQAQSFQQDLPKVVNQLTELPLVGPTMAENNVPETVREFFANLPQQLAGRTDAIVDVAESVTSALVALFSTVLLALVFLIDGPRLVDGAMWVTPTAYRPRVRRLGEITYNVVGRFFAGSLLLAFLQGLQVLVTGLLLGVPLSPLLALWAAVWNLVPQVGGAIGGAPFVAVAFTRGPTTGIIATIVFLVYLTFANNVLLPVIIGRSVDISPLTTMVAVITGFSIAGIAGALLAVPILGAAKAMYFELRPWARQARGDPPPDETPQPPNPTGLRRWLPHRRQAASAT